MEKKMYQIKVVDVTPYGASASYVNLKLDSLGDCMKVIDIAHVVNWEILLTNENSSDEELVERSADYQKFLNKELDERAAWIKSQNEKVERINATPKSYKSKIQFPDGCKIIYERSTAEFKAHISSQIRWSFTSTILCNGNTKSLYVYEYTTKDGKIQVTKFAREMRFLFGETALKMSPEIIKDIVKEYKEIIIQIKNS